MASRTTIISHEENGSNIECDTDIPLVVLGVQATEHQTRALEERKRTPAVGDREVRVETGIPEWLPPFTEGLTRVIVKFDRRISS